MRWTNLFGLGAIAALTASIVIFIHGEVGSNQRNYPSPDIAAVLETTFTEACLSPDTEQRPPWECYDIPVAGAEYQSVVIRHADGETHRALTFRDGEQTKFRFTPTKPGVWSFSTGGELAIAAERPDYAKGFVTAEGQKWVRSATGEAFVPQFVMYDKPDIDQALDEFVEGHGFTGFHITNLRDFMSNPAYFEAAVLKTYRRGGVTHFWIWGDEQRKQTPKSYGVDSEKLYKEIAARLAPMPGWTFSYGFDLFEWASARELENLRTKLQSYTSYTHLFGARGHTHEYKEISSNLDYASWEWRRPVYEDYRDHLAKADDRPAFSEDRFRIRTPSRYPDKDYDPERTYKGLWYSMISGGVGNIWGHQPRDRKFSEPYPNKDQIKTYSVFTSKNYTVGMQPDNSLIGAGYCLRDRQTAAICYAEDTDAIRLQLDALTAPVQVLAVDAKAAYQEIELPSQANLIEWQAPYSSDWAIAIAPLSPADTNSTTQNSSNSPVSGDNT